MRLRVALSVEPVVGAVPVTRRTLGAALRASGASREVIDELLLAITEAITNAVEHAVGSSMLEIEMRRSDDEVVCEVRDGGHGNVDVDRPMPGPDACRGRGVPVMRALLHDLTSEVTPGGHVLRLTKRLR